MFCTNCGAKIADDSVFCSNCGVKLETPVTRSAVPDTAANEAVSPAAPSLELPQPAAETSNVPVQDKPVLEIPEMKAASQSSAAQAQETHSAAEPKAKPENTKPLYAAPQNTQAQNPAPTPTDNGGFGWGLLGCCIPVVGLILFLVWKDTKPKTSRAAGIGALVSVGIAVLFYILAIVAGIGASIFSFL